MFVQVQALKVEGRNDRTRAGRFWPCGKSVRVEVLPQEEDPPSSTVRVKNAEGIEIEVEQPDSHRLGQRSFRQLKADPYIQILADEDSIKGAASAEVDRYRAEAEKLAGEAVSLRMAKESAEARADAAEARVAQLVRELDEAKAKLATAQAIRGQGRGGGRS
jgi:hypothetical protein